MQNSLPWSFWNQTIFFHSATHRWYYIQEATLSGSLSVKHSFRLRWKCLPWGMSNFFLWVWDWSVTLYDFQQATVLGMFTAFGRRKDLELSGSSGVDTVSLKCFTGWQLKWQQGLKTVNDTIFLYKSHCRLLGSQPPRENYGLMHIHNLLEVIDTFCDKDK